MAEKHDGVGKLRHEVKKLREEVDSFSERLHLVEVDVFGEGVQECQSQTYKDRFGEYPVINNLARISELLSNQQCQLTERDYLNNLRDELNLCISELNRQKNYTDQILGLSSVSAENFGGSK